MSFGQTLSGSILTGAEMNAYTFSANANDKVLVRMEISSGSLWSGLRLYDPSGIKICEGGSEIATCTLTGTGTYTILAFDGYDGTNTGGYYVYVQRLNQPGNTTSLNFGQTLYGSILTPAQMNSYTFSASANDKVLVRMSRSSGSLWPGLRLYDPSGIQICDGSGVTTAEIATCTLTSDGTYTIQAYDSYNGTYTGSHYIYLQRLNNPGSPTSMSFGNTVSGSILTPAQMKTYTFSANANDKVLVRMEISSGSLWSGLRLYDPSGIKICEGGSEIATCTLTGTGTYTILAFDGYDGTDTGSYYVYMQRLNQPGNATSLNFGQTLYGSILTPAQMNSYTFSASANDKVLVRMSRSSGSLWPGLQLYDPSGIQICDGSGVTTAEIATCTLTSDGTYTIQAYDSYNASYTGSHHIYLQRLNNPGSRDLDELWPDTFRIDPDWRANERLYL